MNYDYYIVKTYEYTGGGSSANVRVSPLPGQGISYKIKVECSRSMRKEHPIGTLFKLKARLTNREGGTPFLYSRHDWEYEVVSEDEAKKYIKEHF